jgi:uncharacterized membrane protein
MAPAIAVAELFEDVHEQLERTEDVLGRERPVRADLDGEADRLAEFHS